MPRKSTSAFLLVLAACSPNVSDERVAGGFELPAGVSRLRVTLEKGEISLLQSTDGRIRYEAATRRGATRAEDLALLEAVPNELRVVDGEPGELTLVGPRVPAELAERDPGAALVMKILMYAPPDLEVVLETERGRLGVDDRTAPVELRTGSGDIHLRSVHAAAKTFTGSGNHFVIDHRGDLASESKHGNYFVYVSELGKAGVELQTASGNVQCNLPVSADFELVASTRLGEIKSGYELELVEEGRGMRGSGEVGEGGPRVTLRTDRGNVNARPKQRVE